MVMITMVLHVKGIEKHFNVVKISVNRICWIYMYEVFASCLIVGFDAMMVFELSRKSYEIYARVVELSNCTLSFVDTLTPVNPIMLPSFYLTI